jgi:hypothetical protein
MPRTPTPRPRPRRDATPANARLRGGRSERGAALVEALIVISLLILGFAGTVFFRDFYVKTLLATRLARGSVLAYSMTGCGSNNEPAQWIGRLDLASLTAARPNSARAPAAGRNNGANARSTGKAGEVMSRVPGLSDDGGGIMNPTATSDLSGRVRVRTSDGALSTPRTFFDSPVHARSFVSCSDPVRNGDFGEVLDYIGDLFL